MQSITFSGLCLNIDHQLLFLMENCVKLKDLNSGTEHRITLDQLLNYIKMNGDIVNV